jgi:O-antigen ligase
VPFVIVILFTLYNHVQVGLFDQQLAHFVMKPFYNDHTSYGAIIAMFLPILIGSAFRPHFSRWQKFGSLAFAALFIVALIFSYTRAAWVSVVAAIIVGLLIILRIKFRYVAIAAIIVASVIYAYRTDLTIMIKQNEQASSGDFKQHIQSIVNVTTDYSNLERLNRWSCALRMFEEKPVFGWGPGTYMFQYAPFQLSYQRTPISTNFGTLGNAHSEYIGPLAESGVLGMLTFLLIAILTLYKGINLYHNARTKDIKIITMSVLLGLVTYLVHGMLNNFLTRDKASAPFWGFIAIIVALEIYHNTKKELSSSEEATQEVEQ